MYFHAIFANFIKLHVKDVNFHFFAELQNQPFYVNVWGICKITLERCKIYIFFFFAKTAKCNLTIVYFTAQFGKKKIHGFMKVKHFFHNKKKQADCIAKGVNWLTSAKKNDVGKFFPPLLESLRQNDAPLFLAGSGRSKFAKTARRRFVARARARRCLLSDLPFPLWPRLFRSGRVKICCWYL